MGCCLILLKFVFQWHISRSVHTKLATHGIGNELQPVQTVVSGKNSLKTNSKSKVFPDKYCLKGVGGHIYACVLFGTSSSEILNIHYAFHQFSITMERNVIS